MFVDNYTFVEYFEERVCMAEVTYEKVLEMFKENAQQMKENDRKAKEDMEQLRKQMKETDRIIGELGNRFGELAEHLVRPGIVEKFNNLGFNFDKDAENIRIKDPKTRKTLAEIDIFLENGEIVIAVEVKAKLSEQHVKDHIARMDFLRRYADSKGDKRKYRGAIASAITNEEPRNYALKAGFYVLEQSGDTIKLDIPEGFEPREW